MHSRMNILPEVKRSELKNDSSPPVSASSNPVSVSSPPVSASSTPVSTSSPPVSASSNPISASSPPVSASSTSLMPPHLQLVSPHLQLVPSHLQLVPPQFQLVPPHLQLVPWLKIRAAVRRLPHPSLSRSALLGTDNFYLLLHAVSKTNILHSFLASAFLGAFAKLRKTAIGFVMSVRPHRTTQFPLDGFPWNLVFEDFFFKNLYNILVQLKFDKNDGCFTWRRMYIIDYVSHFFLEWKMSQTKFTYTIQTDVNVR